MCDTLRLLTEFLLKIGFKFVLLGHAQSDILEHRFGSYRQMSGSNYFISVKQLLENEKKIKLISYLKHTKVSPHDLQLDTTYVSAETSSNNEKLPDLVHKTYPDDLAENEMHVITYVGGYIAFKQKHQSSCCASCHTWLSSSSSNLPEITDSESEAAFIHQINRGGLKSPSNALYILCVYGYCIFADLENSSTFSSFMQSPMPTATFCSLVIDFVKNSPYSYILDTSCSCRNSLHLRCLRTLFNTLASSYVKQFLSGRSSSSKVLKLQSR